MSLATRMPGHTTRRLIGWGTPRHLPFLLIRAPARSDAVSDGHLSQTTGERCAGTAIVSPNFLRECDPTETSIIILAQRCHWPAIEARLASYGPFPILAVDSFYSESTAPTDTHDSPRCADRDWQVRLTEVLAAARQRVTPSPVAGRTALWLHCLCKGGAERQMALLALGLRQLDRTVDFITQDGDIAEARTWSEQLAAAGVVRCPLPGSPDARHHLWPLLAEGTAALAVARQLTPLFSAETLFAVMGTYVLLARRQPDTIISYLDNGNVIAGLAAVMAGVPHIILSGRNAEPNQFPSLRHFCVAKRRLRTVYRALIDLPGVVLSNNSSAGADSYARWLNVSRTDIAVVPNGVRQASFAPASDIRRQLAIPPHAPIILGIMRLSEEKQPLAFLDVVARVRQTLPELHAILIGDGPLRDRVAAAVATSELTGVVHLVGLQEDPTAFLAACDLLLLTSRQEGMPNVLLEAQAHGKPVVATDVGGVRQAVAPVLHRFLQPYGDRQGLADRCADLINDEALRLALGEQAAAFMRQHYDEVALARNTLAVCATPGAALPGGSTGGIE